MSDSPFILVFPDEGFVLDMYSHAFESYPEMCVGILLGEKEDTPHGVSHWRVEQILHADITVDLAVVRKVETKARTMDLTVLGFYHSHTTEKAGFTEADKKLPWISDEYVYCVVSVRDRKAAGYAAYRLDNGKAVEVGTVREDDE